MKKLFLLLCASALVAVLFPSCTSMKRDCQGRKHERLANGIYL